MTTWYWHIHHYILCEPVFGTIEARIKVIKKHKPINELDLRLRLMRPLRQPSRLPSVLVAAGQDYIKASQNYDKAGENYDKASQDYNNARQDYDKAGENYDKASQDYNNARQD